MSDPQHLTLAPGVAFADLNLRVDGTDYLYVYRPFSAFCKHNRILAWELSVYERGALMRRWYDLHRAAGLPRDVVMDNVLGEIEAENRVQGGVQIPPGCA